MKDDSCFIPQATSSELQEMETQRLFTRSTGKVTLFRLLSGSGVVPSDYFVTMGNSSQTVKDVNKNIFQNFRSILLDEWDDIRPTFMNVTLKGYDDSIVAGLLFKIGPTDNITSWFSKENLLNTFPWDPSYLSSCDYNIFSIIGDPTNMRSFYLNLFYRYCRVEKGVLVIFHGNNNCAYQNQWQNGTEFTYPQIVYVNDDAKAGLWSTQGIPLKCLEIEGIYDEGYTFYI